MPNEKLRRRLAFEAARLIYERHESDPYRAVLRAAKKTFKGWLKPSEFPSEAEIRMQLQQMSWVREGDIRFDNLRDARLLALEVMRSLEPFLPRLTGNAVTGQARRLRQIDLRVFSDDPYRVRERLAIRNVAFRWEQRATVRAGQREEILIFHVEERVPVRLICYPAKYASRTIRRRSTGQRIPQASLRHVEALVRRQHPDANLRAPGEESVDRFEVYRMLLAPLAGVTQSKRRHPEGDALYHSLQVFELAKNQLPYDEEFLLAALLHDVGKAIDPLNHVPAAMTALNGHITERTAWLIENHTDAHRLLDGHIGQRAKRRLQNDENYEELLLLAHCDRDGRVPGGEAPELDAALEYVREITRMCDD